MQSGKARESKVEQLMLFNSARVYRRERESAHIETKEKRKRTQQQKARPLISSLLSPCSYLPLVITRISNQCISPRADQPFTS